MIDWNNDGKIDGEDWMITDIILDEEEQEDTGGSSRTNGSCLASMFLIVALPLAYLLVAFSQ